MVGILVLASDRLSSLTTQSPSTGIVEQVRDGSTLRIRLLLPDDVHQLVNVSLAGVRCAKAGGKDGEPAEPWGEEAKFFTESRLLQRQVRVKLLSLPSPTALPLTSTGPPPPASMFIGMVIHPNGNVAEHLVGAGLARVIDWHAGMLSAGGFMERLRAAEASVFCYFTVTLARHLNTIKTHSSAKEKRLYLYANPANGASTSGGAKANGKSASHVDKRSVEGQVVRVWSGDQISVVDKDNNKERRVQLSSTRAPK